MVVRCAAYAFDFVKMSKNTDAFLKLKMRHNSFSAGAINPAGEAYDAPKSAGPWKCFAKIMKIGWQWRKFLR